jgi:ribosomal protein S18 acetylase RimI-like enzyme
MNIDVLQKSDIDLAELAELTYRAMEKRGRLTRDATREAVLRSVSTRLADDCYEWVFIVERNGELVGCLALYEISDASTAQVWDWHPIVLPHKDEDKTAQALIQEAFSHLKQLGLRQVTIDFPATMTTQSCLNKHLDWFSQVGITEMIEERSYKKSIAEERLQVSLPDGYSLGHISETDLDDLFDCWAEIFASSDDQFFHSLDATGQRALFFKSWNREKPLIAKASLTLYHHGRLIGFRRLLPIYGPTDGCLAPIGIIPEYRRKGLAQALLKMSILKLGELGYRTISCFVSSNNSAAISFYENLGFKLEYEITSLSGEIT